MVVPEVSVLSLTLSEAHLSSGSCVGRREAPRAGGGGSVSAERSPYRLVWTDSSRVPSLCFIRSQQGESMSFECSFIVFPFGCSVPRVTRPRVNPISFVFKSAFIISDMHSVCRDTPSPPPRERLGGRTNGLHMSQCGAIGCVLGPETRSRHLVVLESKWIH